MYIKKNDNPPEYYQIVKQDIDNWDSWRTDVANGAPHPLKCQIEELKYVRVNLGRMYLDTALNHTPNGYDLNNSEYFSEAELQAIKEMMQDPKYKWAIDNSLDGLYISKQEDFASLRIHFSFSVFLKEELATFWKLKY